MDPALFAEPAEKDLYAAMQATVPAANAQFDAGDYTASLQTLAALRGPVDAFFDGVMVNADDPALKANRLGLLRELHDGDEPRGRPVAPGHMKTPTLRRFAGRCPQGDAALLGAALRCGLLSEATHETPHPRPRRHAQPQPRRLCGLAR